MAGRRCGHRAAGTQTFSAQRVPLVAGGGRGGGGGGALKTKLALVVGSISYLHICCCCFQRKRYQRMRDSYTSAMQPECKDA